MNHHLLSGFRPVLFALVFPTLLPAETVFFEDFEAYAPGSNLNGQGGWSGRNGVGSDSAVQVTTGTALAGQVLDGHHPILAETIHFLGHAIPVPRPGEIVRVSFKAHAFSSGPASLNAGLALGPEPVPDPFVHQGFDMIKVWWSIAADGWYFDTRGVGGVAEAAIPSSFDTTVELSLVMDRVAGLVYGTYKDSTRTLETARYPVTAEHFDQLDALTIFQDQTSGRNGVEIDDVLVTVDRFLGPVLLTGVKLESVSSEYTSAPWDLRAIHCIDGSGLSGAPAVHAQLTGDHLNSWQTSSTTGTADIRFDLGAAVKLNHLRLWNLNFYAPYNGRGARRVRMATSTDAATWTTTVEEMEFPMATGLDGDPGFDLCAAAWPPARYVRFEIMSNWGGADNAGHTGLSEVRFYAANPSAPPLTITHFERRPESSEVIVGFPAASGLRYRVETSSNLITWSEAAVTEPPTDSPDWRVTLPDLPAVNDRYFRVRGCFAVPE
jgi:hypothetical protein